MKKGKNMINQKNDLNMITRKLETELLTFHFDGLEISEITTTTSWMKLHINVLFIKDDVQITKVLYKDYETGLWYYIKDNGMIISHKDTFNHTIKNLIDEMIYDCHIEIEEATEDLDEYEDIIENEDLDEIIENENLDEAEETKTTEEIPNVKKCSIAYWCQADRKHNRCGGTQTCRTTWKRYKAIINPEWHHVSLANLSNIDINMLDEKRQRYFKIYQELIKTIQDLHKCKTAATYEIRWWRFKQAITDDILYRETTLYMTRYLDLKISMCNVECGLWASSDEKATGFKKSRRYGHATLK